MKTSYTADLWENMGKALKRDKFKCVKCNSKRDLQFHHIEKGEIIGVIEQKNNYFTNLMTLCPICHAKEHGRVGKIDQYHKIPKMRKKGMTFQEIGNELEISRQRVHQIYKRGWRNAY